MNKISKIFRLLAISIIFFILYEITSIDNKYINRPIINIDIDNIRNPPLKKIARKIDLYLGSFYFNLSKKKQDEFFMQDLKKYKSLPDEMIISPSFDNLTISNNKNYNNSINWKRSHGNHSSNKFSNLKKINIENVKDLKLAWIHEFDKNGDIPGNPIYFNGTIYMSSTDKSLVALHAKDGSKKWEYKTDGMAAIRGLVLSEEKVPKVYFCDQTNLIALSAFSGKGVKKFGKKGKVKLKKKCQITPVIIEDKIIIGTFEPAIEVYEKKEGKLLWKFLLKKKNEDYFRYGGKRYDYSGGNPWGGISADIERKILYVSTGNAGRFYEGTTRPGNNKYANSIVALDIKNQKLLWEFQEIEHDIWNLDIASPPILTSIKRKDKKIDVVVAPTKFGNTLVLDRLTGKSIYGYANKKVPLSSVPGEKTSFYQKVINLPEPFSNQYFKENDITNISKESFNYVKKQIKNATYGFFEPHSINKKNIVYKSGAQWMGASIDNNNGIMYVPSNDIPNLIWLEKSKKKYTYYEYGIKTKLLEDHLGYPGSKPPWGNLTAINLNTGKKIWQIPFGEYEELSKKNIPKTGTYNYGGVTATAGNLVFATGTLDNKVRAIDSRNGQELWSYTLPFSGSSPPTVYEYNKEQYILVSSTGAISLRKIYPKISKSGNKVYAFKLKKND
jgi:quinoprotein glucose dehydrogenase